MPDIHTASKNFTDLNNNLNNPVHNQSSDKYSRVNNSCSTSKHFGLSTRVLSYCVPQ